MTDPDPYTDGADHADRCNGLPIFHQDPLGQWSAHCDGLARKPGQGTKACSWEVTGCETRAEAGAVFYGGQPAGQPHRMTVTVVRKGRSWSARARNGVELFTISASTVRTSEAAIVHFAMSGQAGYGITAPGHSKYDVETARAAAARGAETVAEWFVKAFGLDVEVVVEFNPQ